MTLLCRLLVILGFKSEARGPKSPGRSAAGNRDHAVWTGRPSRRTLRLRPTGRAAERPISHSRAQHQWQERRGPYGAERSAATAWRCRADFARVFLTTVAAAAAVQSMALASVSQAQTEDEDGDRPRGGELLA